MPLIDAGSTGIRPIDRQRPLDGTERVRRRDDGGAFRPQTTVNLKTAIQDLAATLGKIASEEKYGIQKLPQEVGDIVKNILKQSLSLESTLGKGIGSTVESQRFSMDQLMLFSRMLLQIGTLAEKGYSMKLSEDTQALLSNFKDLIVAQEGGDAFEPILMTKSSFELMDAKNAEQLPQALYEILSQLANAPEVQQQQPPSESMQFLKQLIRYFMPRPEVDNLQQEQLPPQGQAPAQQQQESQPQGATQKFLESMFKNFGGKFAQQGQQTQGQFNQPQAQGQAQFTQPQAQGQTQFNQPQAQGQTQFTQPQTQGQFTQPQTQGQAQFTPPNAQGQTQFTQPNAQEQTQFTQPQAQGQTQFTQPNAQGQAQFNQPQAQGQGQFNQPNVQGQTQFNQPQAQGQGQFTQPQTQGQTQFNQPQVQGQGQFNQPQAQGQTQFTQPNAQGQTQFTQPQAQGQTQFTQSQVQGQGQFNQP
ncbi:MAG: hypothetical protein IJL12_04655, partial [Selenomonadaceae bacterium]|nr:hypothetical protein [Selenomonadaceae bacterium]